MKELFKSEQEALDYKEKHQIFGRVPEPLAGTKKWALNFPLKAHVTVYQPHAPERNPVPARVLTAS
jgi:hypothetical protein